jgi:hypothetical protein
MAEEQWRQEFEKWFPRWMFETRTAWSAYVAGRRAQAEQDARIVEAFRHFYDGPEDQIKRYIAAAIRAAAEKE